MKSVMLEDASESAIMSRTSLAQAIKSSSVSSTCIYGPSVETTRKQFLHHQHLLLTITAPRILGYIVQGVNSYHCPGQREIKVNIS